MKNKLIKRMAILMVSAMCFSMLVGCGRSHVTEVSLSAEEDDDDEDVDEDDDEDDVAEAATADSTEAAATEDVPAKDVTASDVPVVCFSDVKNLDQDFHNDVESYLGDCSYYYEIYKFGDGALILANAFNIDSEVYAIYASGSFTKGICLCENARCSYSLFPDKGRIVTEGSGGAASSYIDVYDYSLTKLYSMHEEGNFNNDNIDYYDQDENIIDKEVVREALKSSSKDSFVENDGYFYVNYDDPSYVNAKDYLLATGSTLEEMLAVCMEYKN